MEKRTFYIHKSKNDQKDKTFYKVSPVYRMQSKRQIINYNLVKEFENLLLKI